jgi:hypothetical protein
VTWAGGLTSAGLGALTWPRGEVGSCAVSGAGGAGSGAAFALCANCFRQASLAFDPGHPAFSALVTVMIVQAIQTVA